MKYVINGRFLSQKISGVQRFAIEITKCLIKLNPQIVVLCPPNVELNTDLTKNWNLKIIGTNTGHKWEQWDLPRYLHQNSKPLLLNLCNTAPLFYNRSLVTVHDVCFAKHKEWYSTYFMLFYNMLVPRILKKSIAVFTVSQFSKQEIISYFKIAASKIHVIPNAVSNSFEINDSEPIQKEKIVLSVASIDPRKNQSTLVKAFEKLKLTGWNLVLVGARHQAFSNNKVSVSSNENVRWTGYLEDYDLVRLYHKASIFVYPSLYEGFGIPPLEAMTAGCPVLVSDIPSLRETCGNAAVYFEPLNADELSRKMSELIGSDKLREELIGLGLEKSKEYSWNKSASILLKHIEKLY